jgi:hypothetical protein
VNTLHCLEKWGRGYQRILPPGNNFTVPLLPLKGFKPKTFFRLLEATNAEHALAEVGIGARRARNIVTAVESRAQRYSATVPSLEDEKFEDWTVVFFVRIARSGVHQKLCASSSSSSFLDCRIGGTVRPVE